MNEHGITQPIHLNPSRGATLAPFLLNPYLTNESHGAYLYCIICAACGLKVYASSLTLSTAARFLYNSGWRLIRPLRKPVSKSARLENAENNFSANYPESIRKELEADLQIALPHCIECAINRSIRVTSPFLDAIANYPDQSNSQKGSNEG